MTELHPDGPEPHVAHLVREARVREVATAFLRLRPVILGPFLVATVIVLAASGAPLRQVVALSCGASFVLTVFVVERRRARVRPVNARELSRSLLFTVVGIGLASIATGGIVSPLVPMLFAPLGIGFAAFGPSREQRQLSVVFMGVVFVLAVVAFVAPELALPPRGVRVALVLSLSASALLLRVGVSGLTEAHARAADGLARAGEALARSSEARERDLEALGSRLAHEVKNPLAAVRALVEIMQESADTKSKKRLDVMAGEVHRIQSIVEGYATLARPLDVVRREEVAVAELLTSIVATLEARAAAAGVTIVLSVPAANVTFPLDRHRVHEALANLVLNAIEACDAESSESERAVNVVCEARENEVRVVVEDSGRGMDADALAHVGTPFFTRREGGTGLGVAHAKKVVALHGGALLYESREGKGTRALVTFARRAPESFAPRAENGST